MTSLLLIGGVRSGKSALAVRLARQAGAPVTFIATARAGDEEMANRIARHRADRPTEWQTVEVFDRSLATAIQGVTSTHTVVVDCLNIWVSNLLADTTEDSEVLRQAEEVGAALAARSARSVTVTNEVGLGIHPTTPLGRRFRDVLGTVNQTVASAVDECALVVAGRTLPLDPPSELERRW